MIGSTLLGLSMIDIYSFDFINWIKDTNIYKWYSELFNKPVVNNSKTEIKEPSSILRANNTNSITNETRNERDYEIIKRLQEIVHKDKDPVIIKIDEVEDTPPFYKNKYWIIGAVSITCLISWYYYGDNIQPVVTSGIEKIKTGYGAIIDYLSSFRSSPPDDSTGNNSSGSTISNKLNIKSKLDKYFKLPDNKDIDNVSNEIEALDNVQPIASSSKGKGKSVLTSPSLEDLNSKAQESWGSRSNSPSSEDSSSTVTSNIKVDFPETKKSVLAEFISESPIETSPLEYITKTWKLMFSKDIRDKIEVMDHIWYDNDDINREQADTLADSLAYLVTEYNKSIHNYNITINNLQPDEVRAGKQAFFHFRKFLSFYYERVLPNEDNPITVGNLSDDLENIVINKKV
jgi:hypothetical protein